MDAAKSKKLKLTNNAAVCLAIDGVHGVSALQLQQNDEWCDIVLFGKDESSVLQGIKAHKLILASASAHLREVFESEHFLDSGAAKYHVAQIDHATLRTIIDFIYHGVASTLRISGENIGEQLELVLIGADYLLMPDLVDICGRLLDDPKYLNVDCAISTWLFARKYHCQVLEDAAGYVCAWNWGEVATQRDFLMLSGSDVVSFLKCFAFTSPLASDTLCEISTAWLGFKQTERQADCDEVMRQIPLKSMSANALRRLSEMKFLSEFVLWAAHQVHEVRVELDKVRNAQQSRSPLVLSSLTKHDEHAR